LIDSKPFLREFSSFVFLWFFLLGAGFAPDNDLSASQSNLVVRGTLVCVGKESKEVPCTGKGNALGLKAANGQIYLLKSDKLAETLVEEKRLRSKDFQLTLRKSGDSDSLEIVKSQFFRDGKLYDFYYFCDVCNITTHTAGLCMCCRQETEYREKLAE
jgi:hypothetical protein